MKQSNIRKILVALLAGVLLVCCVSINAYAALLGDVDGNNKITSADARIALRQSAKLENLTDEQLKRADANGDGRISASDARMILRVAAKLDVFANPEIPEDEPSTEEPTTEKPTTEEPSTEEPTTEEPATEQPTTEEPSTEEPSTEEPSTEEPSTEEPSTEEPTTEEPTTEEPSTDEPSTEQPPVDNTDDKVVVTEYPSVINSFFNKKFYLRCQSDINGELTPMELAMNGDNMEAITVSDDGSPASMYIETTKNIFGMTTKNIYMKFNYEGTLSYLKLDELTLKLMGINIDIDSLTAGFDFGTISDYEYIVRYIQEVDGAEYTVYSFITADGKELCFCFDDEENVKFVITKDADGNILSKLYIEVLSSTIPGNMLNLNGYKKLDILSMLTDV